MFIPKRDALKGGSFSYNNTTIKQGEDIRTTLRVYCTLRGKRKCIGWYSNNAYCTWHNATDEQGWMAKLIHSFALQKRWIKGLKSVVFFLVRSKWPLIFLDHCNVCCTQMQKRKKVLKTLLFPSNAEKCTHLCYSKLVS